MLRWVGRRNTKRKETFASGRVDVARRPYYDAGMKSFHQLLYDARPRSITQREAAAHLGVSRATLHAWEAGRCAPTVRQVVTLWEFYGTTGDVRAAMLTAAAQDQS